MQSEVDFWQRVRLYYLEQARGFGMGRLENEAHSLDRTLQALQRHCTMHAGQVLKLSTLLHNVVASESSTQSIVIL